MWLKLKYFIFAGIFISSAGCRKLYNPPAISESNHFLAADGIINTGANISSTIKLSRSLNLVDSLTDRPELGAQVTIQSASGSSFPLVDTGVNGIYVSAPLNLDPTQKYQLAVTTTDGNKYLSALVTPKTAPPVDSITWELVDDPVTGTEAVNIYVNAHDVTNNTRYYRWDFIETWQHQSYYQSLWGIAADDLIFPVDEPSQSLYNCWTTANSASILLGTSITLSSDVISHVLIAKYFQNDPKFDVEYSTLVKQYPLDLEAYNYWLNVQKNSQSLGGLFDLQPAQLSGNFHSITHPNDPVLGYISASSVQEKRIFIPWPGWKSPVNADCTIHIIPTDPVNTLKWDYPDTSYGIYYFNSGNPPTINITRRECIDCRYQGGTNIEPSFWQ